MHLKCIKLWAEHQKSQGERAVICPLCREKFSTFEVIILTKETSLDSHFRNCTKSYTVAKVTGPSKSHYIMASHVVNVESALYQGNATSEKCKNKLCRPLCPCNRCMSCRSFYLCNACFTGNHHLVHSFHFQTVRIMLH